MQTQRNVLAVLLLICAVYIAADQGRPLIANTLWSQDYKKLMFQCDQVMRDHYIAKRALEFDTSPENLRNLQSSELGLLDCHDYDKLRKRMVAWGLSGDDLSVIGIEALEEQDYELREFVEIHEIRYQ
jgi:hypothetical protein